MSDKKICRICKVNVEIKGIISNTRDIFKKDERGISLGDRLGAIGIQISQSPAQSGRICAKCFRAIARIEESFQLVAKLKADLEDTAVEPEEGREKRPRESPSKTPRKVKMFCPSPSKRPGPTRRSLTEVGC